MEKIIDFFDEILLKSPDIYLRMNLQNYSIPIKGKQGEET
jgi:hypothetical protein